MRDKDIKFDPENPIPGAKTESVQLYFDNELLLAPMNFSEDKTESESDVKACHEAIVQRLSHSNVTLEGESQPTVRSSPAMDGHGRASTSHGSPGPSDQIEAPEEEQIAKGDDEASRVLVPPVPLATETTQIDHHLRWLDQITSPIFLPQPSSTLTEPSPGPQMVVKCRQCDKKCGPRRHRKKHTCTVNTRG